MWNELESYKNHFLQWQLPHLPSARINGMVRKELLEVEAKAKRDQLKRGQAKRRLTKSDQPAMTKCDQPATTNCDQPPTTKCYQTAMKCEQPATAQCYHSATNCDPPTTTKCEQLMLMRNDQCLLPPDFDHCPRHSTYFDDRTKLAYGLLALPKLMRELGSDYAVLNWQAINTLSEILLNPWHAQRAINEMDIVRRTQNLFLRRRQFSREPRKEVRQLIRIFYILSLYLNGAEKMVRHRHLLNELYQIVDNKEQYEHMAAQVLRNLSEKTEVLLHLLEQTNALEHLTRIFHKDPCAEYPDELWTHLSHFLELAPERALDAGFFELLCGRIVGRLPHYHRLAMKCFALLLQCGEGQSRFDAIDGIAMLYRILAEEDVGATEPPLGRWEFVVLALQNAVVSKRSLWRCGELTNLPLILVRLARESEEPRQRELELGQTCAGRRIQDEEQESIKHQQLYCLQALRQVSQMPSLKRFIREVCLPDILSMVCCNALNECTRDDLVLWLEREVFHSEPGYFHADEVSLAES